VQQPHSAAATQRSSHTAVRVYARHSPEVDDIAQDGQRQQEHQQLTDTGGIYIVSEVQDTWAHYTASGCKVSVKYSSLFVEAGWMADTGSRYDTRHTI